MYTYVKQKEPEEEQQADHKLIRSFLDCFEAREGFEIWLQQQLQDPIKHSI